MHTSTSSQIHMTMVSPKAEYEKVRPEERKASYAASVIRWLQLKKYQYEVTIPLYMLTPTERFIFNFLLFTLTSMFVIAAVIYLPNHVSIIYNRVWFYVQGSTYSTTFAGAVRTTKAALSYQTTVAAVQQTATRILHEL